MPRVITALLAVVLTAAAVGCGPAASSTSTPAGSTPTSAASPRKVLLASADATAQAGSARVAMDMVMTLGEQGTMRMQGGGAMDFAAKKAQLHFDVTSSQMSGRFEEIIDGSTLYLHMPKGPGIPAKWIKMDLDALAKQQGLASNGLWGAGSDPTQMVDYLRGASSSIARLGDARVRGVATTRYHAVIDFRKAVQNAPAGRREALRQAFDMIEQQAGKASMPLDVWIDADGLLRREQFSLPFGGSLTGMSMSVSFDMYDYGASVDVTPPQPSQTLDYQSLLAGAVDAG